jgi:Carboxypeptidase regulatory-like domain
MLMKTNCVIPKFGFQVRIALALSVFIGALAAGPLWGQATSAIFGNVTDSTGAPLAGATVTVRNTETGVARTTVTDDTGDYRVLSLPVGQYEVRVEKTGFKAAVRSGVDLVVAQQPVVNVQLEVGQVTQL